MTDDKLSGKLAIYISLAAIAVIGIFAFFVFSSPTTTPRIADFDLNKNADNIVVPGVLASDPFLGPKNAVNTIIEFGDYECAACANAASELAALVKLRNDTRLVWKDYPMSGHANAAAAAEAARCANDQGKFWQFHDALFQYQNSLNEEKYTTLAAELKLNLGTFSSCLKNLVHKNEVNYGLASGDAAGIDSLPYLFINGEVYSGNVTAQEINIFLE